MTRSLLALPVLLFLLQVAAPAQNDSSSLSAKQLTKAENVIVQLEQIDSIIANRDFAEYKARVRKLSASVKGTVSNLPEGDLKTDIATAIYLYESAAVDLNHFEAPESAASICANEKPGAYRRLCDSSLGSRRDRLFAKARLHVTWARAGIELHKTGRIDSGRPGDWEAERENDRALARSVISALKILESEVVVYNSLEEFEASSTLVRVPVERFTSDLQKVSADVELILSWLPQNKLKNELANALSSYQDGGLWWRRIYQPRVINVSELVSPAIRTPSDTAYLSTVPYTVAINWRQGSKYLKRAEDTLKKLDASTGGELARLH